MGFGLREQMVKRTVVAPAKSNVLLIVSGAAVGAIAFVALLAYAVMSPRPDTSDLVLEAAVPTADTDVQAEALAPIEVEPPLPVEYVEPAYVPPPAPTPVMTDIMGLSFSATKAEVEHWATERGGRMVCPMAGERRADCMLADIPGLPGAPEIVNVVFVPGLANGRIEILYFSVRQSAHSELLEAARSKYGPESWSGTNSVTTRQGQLIDSATSQWNDENGSIFVNQYRRNPNEAGFEWSRHGNIFTTPRGSF